MSDLPKSVRINEEGPREGFQFEKGPIPTARKIELIDSLSKTGLAQIQAVSFMPPKNVPGMADADEVVKGFTRAPGVRYTGLWLNEQGLQRALATGKLDRLPIRRERAAGVVRLRVRDGDGDAGAHALSLKD